MSNRCRRQTSTSILDGLYTLGDEVGSGGFGKVRLATHNVTQENVAIKIIDKKAIGEDLPRVTTELHALRSLQHQNICRLYQTLETDEKFFIILEFCSGGELFDYIVRKECLQESEARHFFRQIVSAVSYVHHMGFAHRDLKPENLLLTDDLQLKLIDFGLCANPETGLARMLETCCGSPAYAAPELISGKAYFGNEADVWSMGVLLYALLCGCLPFEDDNLQVLYRKIAAGKFEEPKWLSSGSRELLRGMLQTNPKRRITTRDLQTHPWVVKDYMTPLKWRSIYDANIVDEDCAKELAHYHSTTMLQMIERIKKWDYDYLTATYFLLLKRKRKGQPVVLPQPRIKVRNNEGNVLNSPTIHASLESDLDKSGLEPDIMETGFLVPQEPPKRQLSKDYLSSYSQAVYAGTPVAVRVRQAIEDKENVEKPRPKSTRQPYNKNIHIPDNINARPKSVYRTTAVRSPAPLTPVQRTHLSPNQRWLADTPLSAQLKARSNEQLSPSTPSSIPGTPSSGQRTPRSNAKTPGRRRGMFASVERKVDKIKNLLTPKPQHAKLPHRIKHMETHVNVSTTSTDDPNLVLDELIRVFEQKGICCEQEGWKLAGWAKDRSGRTTLKLELEVVFIDYLGKVGVKRKRLNGDAMMYKRVCEGILTLASL